MMGHKEENLIVCALISCMHQEKSIIERTHIQTNVIVVNQCDEESIEEWDFVNVEGKICHAKFISTKERGLSRSRNMAIRNAIGDICLICDDDEELTAGYESIILEAYGSHPEAEVMTFAFNREDKSYSEIPTKHNVKSLLRTSSVEITFRRDVVMEKGIIFDVKMGSGSGNGAGEENMFLMACKRKGLKMFYSPYKIGRLLSTESLWFDGFSSHYFENFGWASRRILGSITSLGYLVYWLIAHRRLYNKDITILNAVKSILKGWRSKR